MTIIAVKNYPLVASSKYSFSPNTILLDNSTIINSYTPPPVVSSLGTVGIPKPTVIVHKNKNDKAVVLPGVTRIVQPLHTEIPVIDVNSDSTLKSKMVNHFMKKTFRKWIYDDFSDVFKYLKIKSGNVVPVKNKTEFSKNKDTNETMELKADWIENNILMKYDMKKILKKYVLKTGSNWYDLKKNSSYVKHVIHKTLSSKIKKHVMKN